MNEADTFRKDVVHVHHANGQSGPPREAMLCLPNLLVEEGAEIFEAAPLHRLTNYMPVATSRATIR